MSVDEVKFLMLWLLSHIGQERTTITLAQMLERQSVQIGILLEEMRSDGLVQKSEAMELWTLSESGKRLLDEERPYFLEIRRGVLWNQLVACDGRGTLSDAVKTIDKMYELVQKDKLGCVAGYLELVLRHVSATTVDDAEVAECSRFTDIAFLVLDMSIMLMKNVTEALSIVDRAIAGATRTGNMRACVLLELARAVSIFHSGMTNFAAMLHGFNSALKLLRAMGDDDLYMRAALFQIYLHFVKGEFQGVLDCYELLQKEQHPPIMPCMHKQMVLVASSAAVYQGYFPHARGMLMSAINTAVLSHGPVFARLFKQHLGIQLVYMGQYEEGMNVLRETASQFSMTSSPKQALRNSAGMAYCLCRLGDVVESHALLSSAVNLAQRQTSFSFSINYPWALELVTQYAIFGLPPIPSFEIDTLLANMRNNPSPMLQGVAFRQQAMHQRWSEDSPQKGLPLLDTSIAMLRKAQAPVELSRSLQLRSRFYAAVGDTARASDDDREARELLSLYGIGEGSEAAAASRVSSDAVDGRVLEECAKKLATGDFDTLEKRVHELALIFRELVGAERAAVFRQDGQTFSCLGTCNISSEEISSQSFSADLAFIRQEIAGENVVLDTESERQRVSVSFNQDAGCSWLFYADSTKRFVTPCNAETLRGLKHLFAAELRNAVRLLAARTAKVEAQHRLRAVTIAEQQGKPVVWGKSEAFTTCLAKARMVATTDAPVLLLGETGVGKEVMADHIHTLSGCKGPFVPIHPASISENLFESELFGHEKGAFTGAIRQKVGLLELANGGTLFIDEVGEVPLSMQTKLLRVLQEHTFMRVGGTKELSSSFRLVAATNRDLMESVRQGSFREDLYYRISVVPLLIPPLRERGEDLFELTRFFVDHFCRRYNKTVLPLSDSLLCRIRKHHWPGNLRELKNLVERAVILHSHGELDIMPGSAAPAVETDQAEGEGSLYADLPTMQELQQRYIRYVLGKTGGRVCGPNGAENILDMKRSTLYLKLRQYGISTRDRQGDERVT